MNGANSPICNEKPLPNFNLSRIGGLIMKEPILSAKSILGVADEPDVLAILEKQILKACSTCRFEKATNYRQATERMILLTFDLVVLDNIVAQRFDLLELAVSRNFPVIMLTTHALGAETLNPSFEMGVRAYLPKEKLGEVVPLLEDVLRHEYLPFWRRIFVPLRGVFNTRPRRTLVEVQG
jgi:CheY-like chemotaxis protein